MKRAIVAIGVTLALPAARADWQYEGQWHNSPWTYHVWGVAVAPDDNVYVDGPHGPYVSFYTPTGSFFRAWQFGSFAD